MDGAFAAWNAVVSWLSTFVEVGLQPFRAANTNTLTIALLAFGIFALIITWIRRAGWRWMKPRAVCLKVMPNAHSNPGAIGISFDDFIRARGKKPEDASEFPTETSKKIWAVKEMRRLQKQHFVVTITHTERDKPLHKLRQFVVLYRELQLWAPQGGSAVPNGQMKLDEDCLKELRIRNEYAYDDGDGREVLGQYNIYVRAARWYDIRHWLLHPNREVRIAVWVTLLTTLVPAMIDAVFG